MWLQGLNVLVVLIALLGAACRALCEARCTATLATRAVRAVYADGRGPLETRMVIVAPGAALDGVCPTTLPVATLSS